jgi:hypothetical protein
VSPQDRWRQRNRFREGLALILLAVAAILFQRSATSAWLGTPAGDGQIEVSPIGLMRHSSGSEAVSCRWWPRMGDEQLCAAAADASADMMRLRRAYPLSVVALWTSVLALFLNALHLPRRPRLIRLAAAAAIPLLALGALWSIVSAGRALQVLSGAALEPVLPGFITIAGGAAFAAAAFVFLLLSDTRRAEG